MSSSTGPERIDTVIVGGGQAGLCMSYVLQREGRPHVVLEKGRALEQWRSARWDSFRINSPIAYSRLMGQSDGLADGTRSIPLAQTIGLWDQCIAQRRFPIRERTEVVSVERMRDGRFAVRVAADRGPLLYEAVNVVAAPGNYQIPEIPEFAARLAPGIQQLRVGTYRNPSAVREGAVLVVGGGQTGVQLAEELATLGRRVYLATSRVKGTPRSYRGEDIMFWLDRTGLLATPKQEAGDGELDAQMPIVGHDHPISHRSLARLGVTLLGRLCGISPDGTVAMFDDSLRDNVAYAQRGHDELVDTIEEWIAVAGAGSSCPPPLEDAWSGGGLDDSPDGPAELDLRAAGIGAVVWATGWRADFGWLHIDEVRRALDARGLPQDCETPVDGFFWLGFHWLRSRSSGVCAGFHRDAPYVAARLRDADRRRP